MKTLPPFAPSITVALLVALITAWAGSGLAQPATGGLPGARIVPAVSNSFHAVTSHLDPGGSFYLYLDTAVWLDGLSSRLSGWQSMLASMPGIGENEKTGIDKAFRFVTRLIQSSGVEEISGIGASGLLREEGLYHTKMMVHHYPDRNKGLLWSMFGTAPHPLPSLSSLPVGTVLASESDLNLTSLWNLIEREVRQAEIPELTASLEKFTTQFKEIAGLPFGEVLDSLPGPFLFVLNLDPTRTISLTEVVHTELEIPEPSLGLVIRTKDDRLFKVIDRLLAENEQVIRVDEPGLRQRTLPVPLPLPVALRPTLAQANDLLILTSQESLLQEILAVQKGEKPGLRASEEFRTLSRDVPLEGNSFTFQSRRFGQTIGKVVKAVVSAQHDGQGPPMALFERFLNLDQVAFGVSRNMPEGWIITSNGSQHPGAIIAAPLLIAPTAIMAGMLLPALAKAKSKAQSINCVSNLKQIGLAALIYANDHDDIFPNDFLAMQEELVSPRILYCPSDPGIPSPRPDDWARVDPDLISYEFVAPGFKQGDGTQIVFRCPIHGAVGYADGSVRQGE